jgi:integrase/recombinase XerD
MATLNLVLDTRRARKDGAFPLVFRIRLNKKFTDIATGFILNKQNFDLKTTSVLNDSLANEQLEQLKSHYLKRLRAYLIEYIGKEDIKEIRNYLVNKLPNEITIIEFWKEHIETLTIAGRNGGAKVYCTSLSVISKEMDLNIPFNKLNYKGILTLESSLYKRG